MADFPVPDYDGNFLNVFNQVNTSKSFIDQSVRRYGDSAERLEGTGQYVEKLLDSLIDDQTSPHSQLLEPITMMKNNGLKIIYTRFDAIGEGSQLIEGVTPPGEFITGNTFEGTLKQYGKVLNITDVGVIKNRYNPMELMSTQLHQSAVRTIDTIAKTELHEAAGIRSYAASYSYSYTDGITIKSTASKISEIDSSKGLTLWDLIKIRNQMIMSGGYNGTTNVKCLISPMGHQSLVMDSWWTFTRTQSGQDYAIQENGTIPGIYGMDFIVAPEAKFYNPGEIVYEIAGNSTDTTVIAANTTKVRVETALVVAPGAGARLDLVSTVAGGFGVEYYDTGFGASSTDPLAQRSTQGWKFWYGIITHTPQKLAVHYFSAPDQILTSQGVTMTNSLNYIRDFSAGVINCSTTNTVADVKEELIRFASMRIGSQMATIDPSKLVFGDVVHERTGIALKDSEVATDRLDDTRTAAYYVAMKVSTTQTNISGTQTFVATIAPSSLFPPLPKAPSKEPEKIAIKLSATTATMDVDATKDVTVTNADDLTNLKVVSATPATATATLSSGKITLTGKKAGTVDVTVSADNATAPKTIAVTVTTPSTLADIKPEDDIENNIPEDDIENNIPEE